MLNINSSKTRDGMRVSFRGKNYGIAYPGKKWEKIPRDLQETLVRNIALVSTIHLPVVLEEKKIRYNTGFPIFESMFYQNMIYDIPSCTMFNGRRASEAIRDFMNVDFEFSDYEFSIPDTSYDAGDNVVIPFTFGKDSLLTFALCRELGLKQSLVHVEEPMFRHEMPQKDILSGKLKKEFNADVERLTHKTGLFRDMAHLGVDKKEFGWGHQTTEYSLLMVPYLVNRKARLVLFGNEQDNNYYIYDDEGFICYPSFDQSSSWTQQQDAMVKILTGNNAGVSSLIEPLNDFAILKILHQRYPRLAKYQMSCFSDKTGKRWCQHCSKCARSYINLSAAGADLKSLGITTNMLEKKFRNYYTVFSGSKLDGFDASAVARDEQLFSFYLAYKNGAKGYLMDEFKKKYLREVRKNEDILSKKYLRVHEPKTIPADLKRQVLSIFREEL
ncbi:hypothetical protein HY638_01610 [Candidatus Woesearchaeota archaeon]|nr:hypothetical protein [Candidatus Woesearchaeota archaeon]